MGFLGGFLLGVFRSFLTVDLGVAARSATQMDASSQTDTERVRILRCDYREKVKDVDPNNLVFVD